MKYTKDEIRKAMLLYAVTDRSWLKEKETLAEVLDSVLENGATLVQIREKDLSDEEIEAEAKIIKEVCARHHVPMIINDSVEIAVRCDADGVHVGQSDIKGRDIRAMIGPDKILGMTARSVEEAQAAEKAGADYIGTGAVFGSTTKKNAKYMTPERLREITASVRIPVVAIGGICLQNIDKLAGSGIDGVAVVSGIFAEEQPGEAAKMLLEKAKKVVLK
ncbi:MAG: thiamine phosphate synthase [Brotaphodocola sp.]